MMNAVWQKIKADTTGRPAMSFLIVITIMAASALLTLAIATLTNSAAPYDTSFEALHGAHIWVYFDRDRIRTRDVERIEALPQIVASTGIQYSVRTRAAIGDTRVWVSVRVLPTEMPLTNALLIQEGRFLAANRAEILGSNDLHDLCNLSTGEVVGITTPAGERVDLPVIGLAYNPTWDTYRSSQSPYLYVTEETMRMIFPDDDTWEWSLGLRLADPNSVDDVLNTIEGLVRAHTVVSHTDWRDVREAAIFGAQLNFVFLGAFSAFAIAAAVLVIASSIRSTVLAQFRQIGILKAIGFSHRQIVFVYTGQYLLLTAVGCPLGIAAGIALAPLPMRSVAASLSTTFEPAVRPWLIGSVLIIISLVVLLATLRSARQGASVNIIKAIAIGAEAPRRRASWAARWSSALGLPMVLNLGINDVSARPARSLMTGLNLMLGVIGIVFGLALNTTLDAYEKDPSLLGIVYDAVVTRKGYSDSRTRRTIAGAPDVLAYYAEDIIDVQNAAGHTFQIRAIEGALDEFPFRITAGRLFNPDSQEALAGQGLLDWLGLEVGDWISLTLEDDDSLPGTWQIVGTYPEPVNAGQMLMVNLSSVEHIHWEPEPRTYYLKLAPDASSNALKAHLEPREDADLNLTMVGQSLPDTVIYLQLAIFALSAILVGIALINVFNTSLLIVREKLRLIGVLKTVGMTPRQVVAMVCTSTGVLGILATVVGIPLGLIFTQTVLSAVSRGYGFGQVQISIRPTLLLLLLPLMGGISVAGSLIPGLRAARTSIVRVLRYE